jgi:hypothetical protein
VRGLIVLVLIIGVCLGCIVHVVRIAQRQRDAVAAVRKVGGSVLYDRQFEGSHVRVKPGTNKYQVAGPRNRHEFTLELR